METEGDSVPFTDEEIATIKAALRFAVAFGQDYYSFAPQVDEADGPNYNDGNDELDDARTRLAIDLLVRL